MKSDQEKLAESISLLLGDKSPEVRVGLSTVGHVHQSGQKFRATARISNELGTAEVDKEIGEYDTYEEARDKVLQMRNMDVFALPQKNRS